MASQVLRRLNKAQLTDSLRRRSAAPFHVIIWDNRPIRLEEALSILERDPDDAVYYAQPERVFSASAPAGGGPR